MILPVLVYGSREFGDVVHALVEDCGREFLGFVDDSHVGDRIVGTFDDLCRILPPDRCEIAIAIGYRHLEARLSAYRRIKQSGYRVATLVHPEAYVARSATVGDGALVMTRAVVDTRARLGAISVIWPGAVINHDAEVGTNTFISPHATVCGHSRVGHSSFIGAGAVIVDHVVTPDGIFVKAATLYTKGSASYPD